jgi:hypothetical protein
MISFHKLINTLFGTGIVNLCTFWGFGGGDSDTSSTTQTDIPNWLKPYVTYGLTEAQNLYQGPGLQYYPGQTYLDPSQQIQDVYGSMFQQGMQGSPITQAATQQQMQTIGGDYLAPDSKYLQAALQPGFDIATQGYYDALKGGRSGAVAAGRMGSGAQSDIESRAEQNLSRALTGQAGQLGYQNLLQERGLQQQSALNAPMFQQAGFANLQQALGGAKGLEGYDQAALQAEIDRFNFQQQAPYQELSSYLGAVYGAPAPMTQQTTQSTSGGKIVCSMMNESYGFGSFRNAVWLKHSLEMPNAKVYEKGYHTLFLPLVAFAKGKGRLNKIVKSVLEHIARHRTADIWLQKKGKRRDTLGRIYRNIIEPVCYITGKLKGAK